ncbi:MAG: low specificity L-threonine aldolase [Alphaproteobacteria bacterium]|nr:low specificity L-threonine aldolase [Alphaproteobacteria bacterium]
MNFCSDNVAGASAEVLQALAEAAAGPAMPYGDDPLTARVEKRLAELFEAEVAVSLVATGTAANALALAALSPPYGAIYCHRDSHAAVDECGAPEAFTGGAKLVVLDGADAKLEPATLEATLRTSGQGVVHHVQPACVTITNATEAGAVYTPDQVLAVDNVAQHYGLPLHMDGARFANAVAHLGCTPAELTWKAGVDVLSFGATKNGCLAAEAVVFFRTDLAADLHFRRKRAGHLFSKMRFLAAQLDAYLTDDLWLANARHANAQAQLLSEGLSRLPGVRLVHPVEANEIFAVLPTGVRDGLRADGFAFYDWGDPAGGVVRLICAFNTDPADVDAFLASAARHAEQAA